MTVDLSTLFDTLFDAYGEGLNIEFQEMDEQEKGESSERGDGLLAVRERFQILETTLPSGVRRRKDLEQFAIDWGQK